MKAPRLSHDSQVPDLADQNPPQTVNPPSSEHRWEIRVCCTLEQVRAVRSTWETLQGETDFCVDIETDIDRYISMLESTPDCEPYTLLVVRDGIPSAMLIATRGPLTVNCKLGYLKILKPTLRGLTIIHGGYLGRFCDQTCRHLLDYLYASLRDGQADVVQFRQLPLDSPLYAPARKQSGIFRRRHWPKIDRHWRMGIPDRMDTFYQQHSAKTRQTLKRQIRQIETEFQTRCVACTEPEMVPRILPDAAAVSSRTYQHALGSGLLDDETTRQQLIMAARRGRLYLHVLYLNDKPCAFQLGLKYHGTYFLQMMGYDPDMKQRNLGTALFLKVLDQLCGDPEVRCLDFGFGHAEYKRRFGTECWDEAAVYLFSSRPYPVLVNLIYAAVSDLSEGLRSLANKSGLEGKIKRKWRNLLSKTNLSTSST